jgi:hypothetical protein
MTREQAIDALKALLSKAEEVAGRAEADNEYPD